MADWPSSLPKPLASQIAYATSENVIRTQMDAGFAKLRRRFTANPEEVSFTLLLSEAQAQTLSDFAIVTLSDVLPFDWVDFRKLDDATTVVYRFKQRPAFRYAGPRLWYADVVLEQLTNFQGTFLLDIEGLTT